jgi:hypothetical protein
MKPQRRATLTSSSVALSRWTVGCGGKDPMWVSASLGSWGYKEPRLELAVSREAQAYLGAP